MKILRPFLALTGLADRAAAHAHTIVDRWDVPHEVEIDGKTVPVPKDLDDRTPRMWGLADGRRITSLLTLDELGTGGPSPAIPLILALIPLGSLLCAVSWVLGLIVMAVAVLVSSQTAGFKITAVAVVLSVLPLFKFAGMEPSHWSHLL